MPGSLTDEDRKMLTIIDGLSRLSTALRGGIALISKNYVSRARNEWIKMAESLLAEFGEAKGDEPAKENDDE